MPLYLIYSRFKISVVFVWQNQIDVKVSLLTQVESIKIFYCIFAMKHVANRHDAAIHLIRAKIS